MSEEVFGHPFATLIRKPELLLEILNSRGLAFELVFLGFNYSVAAI